MLDAFLQMICYKNSERCKTTNKSIEMATKTTTLLIVENVCAKHAYYKYDNSVLTGEPR